MKKILLVLMCLIATVSVEGKKYKYSLAMTAIFRDDAPYLKEWIEFHHLMGVDHFYMINNLSEDNYLEVLSPYIDQGLVELVEWPKEHTRIGEWNRIQCAAYDHVIELAKGKAKWLAIIDTDEFLFPVKAKNLVDLLSKFEKYGGVVANWQVFGTSCVEKIPDDKLLIEMLTFQINETAEINKHVKSIVRPERVVRCVNPHYMLYMPKYYQVNSDKVKFEGPFSPYIQVDTIRINHYTVRDEYYLHHVKLPRLTKWGLDAHAFEESYHYLNEVSNDAILRFVPKLRERMFER